MVVWGLAGLPPAPPRSSAPYASIPRLRTARCPGLRTAPDDKLANTRATATATRRVLVQPDHFRYSQRPGCPYPRPAPTFALARKEPAQQIGRASCRESV